MMGRGLVEPVDDIRSTNPPTNPELLDALARHFQQSDYDLKSLIKVIAMSNVYGLSSTPTETNVSDRLNYSRHYRHRLRAEVLLDAVADITETRIRLRHVVRSSRESSLDTSREFDVPRYLWSAQRESRSTLRTDTGFNGHASAAFNERAGRRSPHSQ